ncbi:hypothetical protein V2G26_007123, partial [Clonostachys chloroleuca]
FGLCEIRKGCWFWGFICTPVDKDTSQIFRFRVRHFQTPRKHQHNCIACEETGRSISQYLSTKQTKSGLYSETARQSHLRGINGDGGAFQPAGGGLSVIRSWSLLLSDQGLFNEDFFAPAVSPGRQLEVAHVLCSNARTRDSPEEGSGNTNLPDGSSLSIRYLEGQPPVNVDPARTSESEGAEVGMCLRRHDDCQDLDTSSLSLLSCAADLAQGSPADASLSAVEIFGPVPRIDTPHCQMGDDEQRQI